MSGAMGDEKEVVFSERQIIREQLAASILQNLGNGRLAATPAGSGRKASLTAQNSLSLAQIECAGRAVPVPGESPPTSPSALKFQDVGIWTTPPHHDSPSVLVLAGDIFTKPRSSCCLVSSKSVENLVGPETLEPVQRLVEHAELVGVDAADLLNGAHVLVVERLDDVAHLAALVGELDADRAPVDGERW